MVSWTLLDGFVFQVFATSAFRRLWQWLSRLLISSCGIWESFVRFGVRPLTVKSFVSASGFFPVFFV